MQISVIRDLWGETFVSGSMFVDGDFLCYTLEDKDRERESSEYTKVYGKTAIPRGGYQVIVNMSPKFKRLYPRLLDVPGYQGVLIHEGNTEDDTEGCILVGMSRASDGSRLNNSTLALKRLMEKLEGQDNIEIVVN